MSSPTVVYISGPISLGGVCSEEEIAAFSEVFYAEDKRLRAHGYEVLNPCRTEAQDSWEGYMRQCLASVCRADVVAVLPRWLESRGAMLEAFVARQLAIPVVPVETLPGGATICDYHYDPESRCDGVYDADGRCDQCGRHSPRIQGQAGPC